MNLTLGSGDESKGRPVLGGIGQSADGASARQGAGYLPGSASEAIARIASAYSSGAGFSSILGDFTFGGANPGNNNQSTRVIER